MILVIGGLASGKRTYAASLGFSAEEVVADAHELVRGADDDAALADELAGAAVVTCAEVGSGIVPIDREERVYRERVGRLSCELAARADAVVRMVCGIPTVLKGDPSARPAQGGALQDGARQPAPDGPVRVELVLVRHGLTPGNEQKRYVGALDQPLSDAGRAQARAAGAHGDVRRVYVSAMRRTRETAAIMFPQAEQVIVEGVQEMDFGAFAGRTADEMADDAEYRAWVEGGCEGRCPGGESQAECTDRICAALDALLRQAAARGEQKLVMVAHGGTMMAFLHRYAHDDSRAYWDWLVGNCEGYRLGIDCRPEGIALSTIDRW